MRTRHTAFSLGVAFLGMLPMVGCSGVDGDETPTPSGTIVDSGIEPIHVEVDVFSGRENPECVLEGAEAQAVADAFGDPLPAGVVQTPPSVLGFRGVVITGDALPGGDDVRSIRLEPEGYYVESTTTDPRFVDDPVPYTALAPLVVGCLDESMAGLLPFPAGL